MANYLLVSQPDLLPYPKTVLSSSVQKNTTELKVNGTAGFSAGDFAVVDNFTTTAELVKIQSVNGSEELVLSSGLLYPHNSGAKVVKTLFNKIDVFSGSSSDILQHTLLTSEDINWVVNQTLVLDTSVQEGETKYYSYRYRNSETNTSSPLAELSSFGMPLDVTPDFVRQNYLYGLDLTEDNGLPLPDTLYWIGIKQAYSWLEQLLHIDILPRTYTAEQRDFNVSAYQNYITLTTLHYPVRSVLKVEANYYGQKVEFPVEWVRINKRLGQLNMVPSGLAFSRFLIPASGGGFLPLLSAVDYIPGFWEITYETGFRTGELPYNLRDIIAKKACFVPLNILGDLVGGVAIASKSIGIDGLSQNINTTSSAENAGYSARLRQYEREFKADIPALQAYWSRITFEVV